MLLTVVGLYVIGVTDTLIYKEDSPCAACAEKKPCFFVHCSSSALQEKALTSLLVALRLSEASEWMERRNQMEIVRHLMTSQQPFFFVCFSDNVSQIQHIFCLFLCLFFFFWLCPMPYILWEFTEGEKKSSILQTSLSIIYSFIIYFCILSDS